MTVYIKSGGGWYAVPNGKLAIKEGGVWKTASFCRVRQGGAWYDSGYRGYPNPPQNFYVSSWDNTNFQTLALEWDPPAAGGAPVSRYRLVKTDPNGNWVAVFDNIFNDNFGAIGMSQDERCQFYVQSISASGLESGWVGPIRVQMGHTEQSHVVTDTLTRAWATGMDVNAYNGTTQLLYVPASVNVSSWYLNLSATFSTSVLSPTASREINHVFNNVIQGEKLNWSNPTSGWFSYVYNGNNNWWGFYSHGSGWSAGGTGGYRMVGRFEIHGTETYYQNRTVIDRSYQGNSTW